MPVEVIGHDHVRTELAEHRGSFALIGPSGVGRSRIVAEWIGGRPHEPINFGLLHQAFQPGVVYTVDADAGVVPWERLLRPLEEGRLTAVVLARQLPAPIQSRLPVFRVGLLSDFEIGRILQAQHKMVQPRQLIARLLGGSMDRLTTAVAAAEAVEPLEMMLAAGRYDPTIRITDYEAALFALQAICADVVTGNTGFRVDAMAHIPWAPAYELLSVSAVGEHQARNIVVRFLREVLR